MFIVAYSFYKNIVRMDNVLYFQKQMTTSERQCLSLETLLLIHERDKIEATACSDA